VKPGAGSRSALAAFIESASHELLAATWWFDPAPSRAAGSIVVRSWGHRQGVGAHARPGDQFVHDERIDGVLPDGGPVSVTARIRGINPGEWIVSAKVLAPDRGVRGPRSVMAASALPLHTGGWSWRSWSLRRSEPHPVKTCLAPIARVPAVIPGVWAGMVTLGLIVALAMQQAVLARLGLQLPQTVTVFLVAIAAGVVGAKIRFMAVHRHEGRFEGWSIQGFLTAVAIVGPLALAIANVPIGVLLDASAPGLFIGLAIGRIGCFFAGCCAGRPTSAGWGVWSSDQRLGMRRIPTQLLESGLALGIGAVALVAVLGYRPLVGGIFVAALALYTLVRQGILRLRVERPKSVRGGTLIAAASAVVLIADVALLALGS
jgi:phosphatidylglycerol---prolipoprotein diacylglyceryl transferase